VRSVIADLGEPLPFGDDSLDRVVSLNVAEHVDDPAEHVRDCHRVLRRGGLLVLAHSDWDTALFTSHDDLLTRRLVDRFASDVPAWAQRADGFMGRKIVPLAVDSPFEIVTVETWADCHRRFDEGSVGWKVATGLLAAARDDEQLAAQAEAWLAGVRRLAAADRFLFTVTDVAALLRKP
jgi:SAM-dependent methyltransferase